MAVVSIGFGVILAALGVLFYFPEQTHKTALIPSYFGLAFIVLGLLAFKEGLRKHVMHLASVLGLLGFLFPAYRAFPGLMKHFSGETPDNPNAVVAQGLMAVICLVFTGLCINSFIEARRARKAA